MWRTLTDTHMHAHKQKRNRYKGMKSPVPLSGRFLPPELAAMTSHWSSVKTHTFPHLTCSLLLFFYCHLAFYVWFPFILLLFYKRRGIILPFLCKFIMSFTILTLSTASVFPSPLCPSLLLSTCYWGPIQKAAACAYILTHFQCVSQLMILWVLWFLFRTMDDDQISAFHIFFPLQHLSVTKIILSVDDLLWFCFSILECKFFFICLFDWLTFLSFIKAI